MDLAGSSPAGGTKKLIKLDTFKKLYIFITKQIKTQMKNLHIILLGGLAIAEDRSYMEMV